GLMGGGKGKVNEASHLAGLFFIDEFERVKVLDLGGEGDREASGIEALNGPHAAGAGQKLAPNFGRGVAHTAHQPQAGDDNSSGHRLLGALRAFLVLFDVVDRVLDGLDLLGILVGNLQVESFLELHYQLNNV